MKIRTCCILIIIALIISYFIALWTDSNLEYWLTYFKGENVEVPMWLSWVLSIILNAIIIALNLVSELVRMVMP